MQKIPDRAYLSRGRASVFQNYDVEKMDFSKIPFYPKPLNKIEEITSMLKKSFLTKNLNDDQVRKIAGAMQMRKVSKGQDVITYGDFGNEYFILASGTVRVFVYKDGTDPKDPDLESKI